MAIMQLQSGVVIHTRAYGDTSLLVELFSQELGRVGLIARGARGPRSRYRSLLQPFQPLLLNWRGRGELKTLAETEADGPPWGLRGDALLCGYYLNELVMRLLPREDPAGVVYQNYIVALAALGAGQAIEPIMRVFEKRMLEAMGLGLVLDQDQLGQPLQTDQLYHYQFEQGPVLNSAEGWAISGQALLAIGAEHFDSPAILAEVKGLMRRVLREYLGTGPLRSREVWQQLRRPLH